MSNGTAEGLNKPCQGNVNDRKSFAAEGFNVKIPFISQTYTKALGISFRQSHTRTRNLVKYHPRVVFTESFHAMVSTDEEVCSPCEREFDRHCKVQEKRHRGRERSRLPIKKIISSMKKRKARRKLKRIFRKSTPKSSSLYKLATDTDATVFFFTNFANLKRWAANKLLQNSKQASMHCLGKHKTVKSCSLTKRYCVSKMKLLMSGDIELNPGKNPFDLEYPVCKNTNGVEITVIRLVTIPHVTIIGVYRSPKVPVSQMCLALLQILTLYPDYCIFIGELNVNWLIQKRQNPTS